MCRCCGSPPELQTLANRERIINNHREILLHREEEVEEEERRRGGGVYIVLHFGAFPSANYVVVSRNIEIKSHYNISLLMV